MNISTASKSTPQQIFSTAGIIFLLIACLALGLVIYFVATMSPAQVIAPAEEIDFGGDWSGLIPYLDTYKKPIVILLIFVLATEFGLIFLILSCISKSLFKTIFEFLGLAYTEIKSLVIGIISWLLTVIKAPFEFVIDRFTPLQSAGIISTVVFLFLGWLVYDWQEGFCALGLLTFGITIGSLIETKKKYD